MPLVSVCPRSGTNYWWYLLGTYDLALRERFDVIDERVFAHIEQSKYDLGVGPLVVGHVYCPGFEKACDGPIREKWNSLTYEPGWDVLREWVENHPHESNPTVSAQARILYQYRNPLDQIVSRYVHDQQHVRPGFRGAPLSEVLGEMLDNYIRCHVTYKMMKAIYPDNIMMLPYETIMAAPRKFVPAVLRHLGHEASPGARMDALERALALTTPQKLREMELRLGRTLARDQKGDIREVSHMRGGKTGKWTDYIDQNMVAKINARMREFDLDLNEFVLN